MLELNKSEIRILKSAIYEFKRSIIEMQPSEITDENYDTAKCAIYFSGLGLYELIDVALNNWLSSDKKIDIEKLQNFIPAINQMIFSLKNDETTDADLLELTNLMKKIDKFNPKKY